MHYGLAHDSDNFRADNLYKIVHLAPCFVSNVPDWTKGFANETVFQFQDYGVYAIEGPNWEEDLKTIRQNFGFTVYHLMKKMTGS